MYNLLKKCFLFKHLSSKELELHMKNINYRILTYRKGQYIENFNNEIGIVLKGKIEVQKNLFTGKKIIMNKIKPGNIFGIAYLFQENVQNITYLFTHSESTILFIGENDLLKLFQLDQGLLKNYLSYVSQRIHFLNQRVECFTYDTIKERVIEFFEQLKLQQNKEDEVLLFFTKCELADYLGISRSSLYRILKELEEKKYFILKKNKILFQEIDKK